MFIGLYNMDAPLVEKDTMRYVTANHIIVCAAKNDKETMQKRKSICLKSLQKRIQNSRGR